MKNIKYVVLLMILWIIPIMVMADGAPPEFTEYNARVSNHSGTSVYEFEYNQEKETYKFIEIVHLDYDTIIKSIYYGTTINNVLYIYVSEYDGYVLESDLTALEKDLELNNFKLAKPLNFYVFKDGAYLYKGPSKAYGKVDGEIALPIGHTIECNYADNNFCYVTYNDVSGWVYFYQPIEETDTPYKEGSSLVNISSGEVITTNEAKLYSDNLKAKVITTIPKNVKLSYKYTYGYSKFNKLYYLEYDGKSGWLEDASTSCEDCYLFNEKPIKVCEYRETYDSPGDCSKIVINIPENKIIPVKYTFGTFEFWYYIEYNGISGWVFNYYSDDIIFNKKSDSPNEYYLNEDTYLYTDIYANVTDWVIPAGKLSYDFYINDVKDDTNYYVWLYLREYNGWIKIKRTDFKNESLPQRDDTESKNNKVEDTQIKNQSKKIFLNRALVYFAIGALLLSLTMLVTIKLINYKKENTEKREIK